MPKLKRYWRALQKKEKQADEGARNKAQKDSDFITNLMQIFLQILSSVPKEGKCIHTISTVLCSYDTTLGGFVVRS